jgi:HD-GYP domain-containing protein (c-di-GMP phosphodiesterase class II)
VFVPGTQFDRLVGSCRRKLLGLIKDDSIPLKQKASLLFGNAQLLAAQALQREELEQSVENALYYFDSVVYFVQATPGASAELCRMLTYDYTLFNHSINVSLLAVGFGSYLDLGTRDIHNLGLGALFHDLGKTKLEDKVLKKRGALDQDEWDQVRRHPRIGFQLLEAMKHFPAECLDMVRYHHENVDGSGYPYGLKGHQLSRPAMIAKIIDCYDAITSDRSYKRACSGAEAIKIMHRQMGGHLSRELFMAFIAFLGDLDDGGGRGPESRPRVLQDGRPA